MVLAAGVVEIVWTISNLHSFCISFLFEFTFRVQPSVQFQWFRAKNIVCLLYSVSTLPVETKLFENDFHVNIFRAVVLAYWLFYDTQCGMKKGRSALLLFSKTSELHQSWKVLPSASTALAIKCNQFSHQNTFSLLLFSCQIDLL